MHVPSAGEQHRSGPILWFLLILFLVFLPGCGSDGGGGGPIPVSPPQEDVATIESPVRIDLTGDGTVVVSDFSAGRLFFLDPATLQVTDSFSAPSRLAGVAVDGDIIFLGMEATGAVGAYDFSGQLLYKLGSGNGEFVKPNDMFVDRVNDRIYVVDTGAKVVKVYTLDGTAVQTDFGLGRLNYPTGIAFDESSNTILVSDFAVVLGGVFGTNVPGVWRFDLSGNVLEKITGLFSRPQGLAVEGEKIFLVDSLLGQVLVLQGDPASTAYLEVTRFGGDDPGDTVMRLPLDAVIDPVTKDLFVTSNALGKVELFVGGGGI